MEIILGAIISVLAGLGLGYVFFWGLWKTVERMSTVTYPYLWMFGSFVIRMTIVVTGFYLMLQFHWILAALGLAGFITLRMILLRRYGKLADIKRNK